MIEIIRGDTCPFSFTRRDKDNNVITEPADKTKFVVLRQTSLYGTTATTNNDIGADVFKIEGYYD